MKFFEAVPDELFSPLASPNRALYADALDVLYTAYREKLKLPEDMLYSMLRSRLEQQLAELPSRARTSTRTSCAIFPAVPVSSSASWAARAGLKRSAAQTSGIHYGSGLQQPSARAVPRAARGHACTRLFVCVRHLFHAQGRA